MDNKEKGKRGEDIAVEYIESRNGEVIERNYWSKYGEIDIIAEIDDEIVFIEVKSRNNINFGYPAEAVNIEKQRRIINTAKCYLAERNIIEKDIRFDVIEVYMSDRKLRHIVNAF